jgi:hypothetical protein
MDFYFQDTKINDGTKQANPLGEASIAYETPIAISQGEYEVYALGKESNLLANDSLTITKYEPSFLISNASRTGI